MTFRCPACGQYARRQPDWERRRTSTRPDRTARRRSAHRQYRCCHTRAATRQKTHSWRVASSVRRVATAQPHTTPFSSRYGTGEGTTSTLPTGRPGMDGGGRRDGPIWTEVEGRGPPRPGEKASRDAGNQPPFSGILSKRQRRRHDASLGERHNARPAETNECGEAPKQTLTSLGTGW
jgi:hypothetical protein